MSVFCNILIGEFAYTLEFRCMTCSSHQTVDDDVVVVVVVADDDDGDGDDDDDDVDDDGV